MNLSDELFERVQNYTSGCSSLTDLNRWISDHLTEFVEMPDDDEGGMLWGFIQVRVYQLQDGFLSENQLPADVGQYLRENPAAKQRQRAAG
jgi:hypothetical protein